MILVVVIATPEVLHIFSDLDAILLHSACMCAGVILPNYSKLEL